MQPIYQGGQPPTWHTAAVRCEAAELPHKPSASHQPTWTGVCGGWPPSQTDAPTAVGSPGMRAQRGSLRSVQHRSALWAPQPAGSSRREAAAGGAPLSAAHLPPAAPLRAPLAPPAQLPPGCPAAAAEQSLQEQAAPGCLLGSAAGSGRRALPRAPAAAPTLRPGIMEGATPK